MFDAYRENCKRKSCLLTNPLDFNNDPRESNPRCAIDFANPASRLSNSFPPVSKPAFRQ